MLDVTGRIGRGGYLLVSGSLEKVVAEDRLDRVRRSPEGLPTWPAFVGAPRALMVLGERIGPRVMPADDARRAFLDARTPP